MILPGDSGGSFACKNSDDQWVHMGQNSAMSYNYESLIAPAHLARKFVDLEKITETSPSQKKDLKKIKIKLKIKSLTTSAQSLLNKGRKELDLATEALTKLTMYSELNLEALDLLELDTSLENTKTRLESLYEKQFEENKKYFVTKFTHISKTKSSQLLNSGPTEVEDYDRERLAQFSVLNVGDNPSNQFTIKTISDDKAFGSLKVQGTTQHYGCVAMILCRKKIVTDVVVNLKDLRL